MDKSNEIIKVGDVFESPVKKIIASGLFVELVKGRDGYLHISQVSKLLSDGRGRRIERIEDHIKEGDIIKVRVQKVDEDGKIRLESIA